MKRFWNWLRARLISDDDVQKVLQCVHAYGYGAAALETERIVHLTGLSQGVVNAALGLLDYRGQVTSSFRHRTGSDMSPVVVSFSLTPKGHEVISVLQEST